MKKNKIKITVLAVIVIIAIVFGALIFSNKGSYKIAFDYGTDRADTVIEVSEGESVQIPEEPVKEGYVFVGWYYGDEKFDFNTKITGDMVLTAKWKKVEESKDEEKVATYTVTFNTDGGSTVKAQTIETGKVATKPTDPKKEGYVFKGWYLGDNEFNFSTTITKDITLTAKWEKEQEKVVTYTVTFDTVGGSAVKAQTIETGKVATKPADPVKEGYAFKGWYLGDNEFNFSTIIAKDITLTAKWEKEDVITWSVEEVKGSLYPQQRIFILKNGVKVAGTADFVDSTGAVVRKNVPTTGKIEPAGSVKNLKNITIN